MSPNKKETIREAKRVRELPPYLFARIDRLKSEVAAKGVDIIDLGVGDPDQPTPSAIIQAMDRAIRKPENHRYPAYAGSKAFRASCAAYLKKRTGVRLDPEREVLGLIGSKEGIGHLPLAFIDPGDISLVPDPGYPVYQTATRFCGGEPFFLPLKEENGFLPNLDRIPKSVWKRAKLLFLNYPNNPTGARASGEFFEKTIELASRNGVLIAHDAAYFEIYSGRQRPLSILEIPGGREVSVEFFSHSKTFNMTGWRIAFAAGAPEAIDALGRVKNNLDSGQFTAVQDAGIAANDLPAKERETIRNIYTGRRKAAVKMLEKAGFRIFDAGATFYVWIRTPGDMDSTEFAMQALETAGVVVTPGVGFGPSGEGYFRLALCQEESRVSEAVRRLTKIAGPA